MSGRKWTRRLGHRSFHSLAFKIRIHLLAHAHDRKLNDQEGNATYLSPSHWCRRMILQPMMKVSILDASIYGLRMGVGPGLVRWKP